MTHSPLIYNLKVLHVFFKREMIVLRKDLFSMTINAIIWPIMSAMIYGFVMPALGVPIDYGSFVLVGVVVATWIYTTYEHVLELGQDLEGNRLIDYELTLPIKPWMVLVKYGLACAFHSFLFSFPLLFVGGIFLGERFSFAKFNYFGYVMLNILGTLVFSFFSLWVCAWSRSRFFVHIRVRLYDPLFFLGCYMSSWAAMAKVLPVLSWIMLANPVTHAMEATRVTVFGQQGYLPFWVSVAYLFLNLFVWAGMMLYAMRKRLDFI